MKKSGRIGLTLLLAVIVAGFVFTGSAVRTRAKTDDTRIADGIYIGSINVGGMTEEEAKEAIDSYAQSVDEAVFTLSANGKSVNITAKELGITFQSNSALKEAFAVGKSGNLIKRYKDKKDLEQGNKVFDLPLSINETAATEALTAKAEKLNDDAVNNGLVRENGQFKFIAGHSGVEVNVVKSVEAIEEYLKSNWDGTDASIDLIAEVVEPEGSEEQLKKVKDLLGSYSTNYKSSSAGRCKNISVAAGKIDGTVLYPGEEFSVGKAISPLTAAGGYELAGAYENGQTVQSYGGGVCQVSTTLYNAVLNAELEVTQRSNHSMIVTYVKPSMDAAIAGDYKDLKFVNNRETPIYIEGYTVGKDIYFNIYGEETRPSNRKVTYESEVVSENNPPVQFVATADPVGHIATVQGQHTGYVAKLWKIVTVDGVEQSREAINKSTYKASPKIVNVGTASADPNVTAAVNAAIATGDEATITATVSQYSGAGVETPGEAPAEAPAGESAEAAGILGTVNESDITGNTAEGQ